MEFQVAHANQSDAAVLRLDVLVKHVVVVHPNAPVFRYVPAKNAVVFLRVPVCQHVRVKSVVVHLNVLVKDVVALHHVLVHVLALVVDHLQQSVTITCHLHQQ